jgi:hypothetical protein
MPNLIKIKLNSKFEAGNVALMKQHWFLLNEDSQEYARNALLFENVVPCTDL